MEREREKGAPAWSYQGETVRFSYGAPAWPLSGDGGLNLRVRLELVIIFSLFLYLN